MANFECFRVLSVFSWKKLAWTQKSKKSHEFPEWVVFRKTAVDDWRLDYLRHFTWLKMTTAQVVETYSHPDDHTRKTTDTPGFKLFSTPVSYWTWVRSWEAWRRLAHVFKLNFLFSATFVASCWLVPSSNVEFLPNANTFKQFLF